MAQGFIKGKRRLERARLFAENLGLSPICALKRKRRKKNGFPARPAQLKMEPPKPLKPSFIFFRGFPIQFQSEVYRWTILTNCRWNGSPKISRFTFHSRPLESAFCGENRFCRSLPNNSKLFPSYLIQVCPMHLVVTVSESACKSCDFPAGLGNGCRVN